MGEKERTHARTHARTYAGGGGKSEEIGLPFRTRPRWASRPLSPPRFSYLHRCPSARRGRAVYSFPARAACADSSTGSRCCPCPRHPASRFRCDTRATSRGCPWQEPTGRFWGRGRSRACAGRGSACVESTRGATRAEIQSVRGAEGAVGLVHEGEVVVLVFVYWQCC